MSLCDLHMWYTENAGLAPVGPPGKLLHYKAHMLSYEFTVPC